MKAWQWERENILKVEPCYTEDDNETIWEEEAAGPELAQDAMSKMYWHSQVPGSRAPESICNASVQAIENRGYVVENARELLDKGFKAYEDDDIVLHKKDGVYSIIIDDISKDEILIKIELEKLKHIRFMNMILKCAIIIIIIEKIIRISMALV